MSLVDLPVNLSHITPAATAPVPVWGYDATSSNLAKVPAATQLAGYDTGSGGVPWTDQQFADHPGALRIGQSPVLSEVEFTSDYLDIERSAATVDEAAYWLHQARTEWTNRERPGQRWPGFYISQSSTDSLADKLMAEGYTSGVPLIVAHWGISVSVAEALLGSTYRCFQYVGVQYLSGTFFDYDVWDRNWLDAVNTSSSSGAEMYVTIPGVPGQWIHYQYFFDTAGTEYVVGAGTSGTIHWTMKRPGGTWSVPVVLQ